MGQSPLLGGVAMSFLPSAGLGSRSAFLCGQSQTAQAIKAHLRLNDTKTRIFSTLAWKRINKKLTVKSRIVCRPSATILRAHTLESPFLKKKVLRNEENP